MTDVQINDRFWRSVLKAHYLITSIAQFKNNYETFWLETLELRKRIIEEKKQNVCDRDGRRCSWSTHRVGRRDQSLITIRHHQPRAVSCLMQQSSGGRGSEGRGILPDHRRILQSFRWVGSVEATRESVTNIKTLRLEFYGFDSVLSMSGKVRKSIWV